MDLIVRVSGEVTASNLDEYKTVIFAQIDEIDTTLETEDDFIRAKKTIADLKKAEAAVEEAREQALNETTDIRDLFVTMTDIADKLHDTWSDLEKRIAAEKKRVAAENKKERKEVVAKGITKVEDHVFSLIAKNDCLNITMFDSCKEVIVGAGKNKKKPETTQIAVDEKVKECIEAATNKADFCLANYNLLKEQPKHLFPDASSLIQKSRGEMEAIIDKRVAEYNLEQERKERAAKEAAEAKAQAKKKAASVVPEKGELEPVNTIPRETSDIWAGRLVAEKRSGVPSPRPHQVADQHTMTVILAGTRKQAVHFVKGIHLALTALGRDSDQQAFDEFKYARERCKGLGVVIKSVNLSK